jgi:hypothetical protein
MFSIVQQDLPQESLLRTYRGGLHPERWGKYGDCFAITVDRQVTLAEFVFAFYTSRIFRIERFLLGKLAAAPAGDSDARLLALGTAQRFSIWYMGQRTETQLLMCDRYERTRSWFRIVPLPGERTLLQFGSAVASRGPLKSPGAGFGLMLKFHVGYSQMLLRAANRGISAGRRAPQP